MTSPFKELQGAIVGRLKATGAVTAIVDDRVYDHVPRASTGEVSAKFPFVGISSFSGLTEDADCIPGMDIAIDVDCWSQKLGFPEVHDLSEAVKQALHDDDTLTLSNNALANFQHRETRAFRDPDGVTSHAVLTFSAFVEQP